MVGKNRRIFYNGYQSRKLEINLNLRKGLNMELNRNNMKKILGIITFTLVLLAALLNLKALGGYVGIIWGILFPFALGGAIAFILNIPMAAIEARVFRLGKNKTSNMLKEKTARPVSMILSVLLVFAIVAVVIGVVVPQLGNTFDSIGTAMTAFLPKAQKWLQTLFQDNEDIVAYISSVKFDWHGWIENIKDFALSGAGSVLSYTMSATMIVVNGVMTFFISFIFALYILIQKETLGKQARKLITALFPRKAVDKICYICQLSHRTFSRFITGQCLEALILGTMFFISMTIFRLPYALMVGVLIAFTALIPIVGAFIGCFVGALLILMVNPMQALVFVILFLVLQQVEGNLIYPHVVGNSVGLPSIWVLVAVTAGGKLMGIVGMLIFIPLVSVFYSLLRDWMNARLARKSMDK